MLPGELLHPSQDLLPLDRVEHVAGGQGLHIIEDDQVDAVDHLDDVASGYTASVIAVHCSRNSWSIAEAALDGPRTRSCFGDICGYADRSAESHGPKPAIRYHAADSARGNLPNTGDLIDSPKPFEGRSLIGRTRVARGAS